MIKKINIQKNRSTNKNLIPLSIKTNIIVVIVIIDRIQNLHLIIIMEGIHHTMRIINRFIFYKILLFLLIIMIPKV